MKNKCLLLLAIFGSLFIYNTNISIAQCGATYTYTVNPTGLASLAAINISPANNNVYWTINGVVVDSGANVTMQLSATTVVCVSVVNFLGCSLNNNMWCDSVVLNGSGCSVIANATQVADSLYSFSANTGGVAASTYLWTITNANTGNTLATGNTASMNYILPTGVLCNACLVVSYANGCTATNCTTAIYNGSNPSPCNASFYIYPDSTITGLYYGVNTSSNNALYAYTWSWGDGSTSTGVTPNHSYAASGTYIICLLVTAPNCADSFCLNYFIAKQTDASAIHEIRFDLSNGITNYVKQNKTALSAIPNPTDNETMLNINPAQINEVIVFNLNGSKAIEISNPQTATLNTSSLAPGIYFIKANKKDGTVSYCKLIKN
jgi:hypothetical protein